MRQLKSATCLAAAVASLMLIPIAGALPDVAQVEPRQSCDFTRTTCAEAHLEAWWGECSIDGAGSKHCVIVLYWGGWACGLLPGVLTVQWVDTRGNGGSREPQAYFINSCADPGTKRDQYETGPFAPASGWSTTITVTAAAASATPAQEQRQAGINIPPS